MLPLSVPTLLKTMDRLADPPSCKLETSARYLPVTKNRLQCIDGVVEEMGGLVFVRGSGKNGAGVIVEELWFAARHGFSLRVK